MKCSYCGGPVTWRGPITDLTHTECESCGRQNCQEVEPPPEDDEPEAEWEHPCPFRGEPTKTPAGESCSACGLTERHIEDACGVPEPVLGASEPPGSVQCSVCKAITAPGNGCSAEDCPVGVAAAPARHLSAALDAPGCERLRDFYAVGPAQRAAVESFTDALGVRVPVVVDGRTEEQWCQEACRIGAYDYVEVVEGVKGRWIRTFTGERTPEKIEQSIKALKAQAERYDRTDGVLVRQNEQKKGLAACPTSRGNLLEIEPNERATEERNRSAGGEEQGSGSAARGDAIRAGGAEPGARGSDPAQHEVAQGGGTGNGAAHGAAEDFTPCAICESPELCKQEDCGSAEWKRTHGVEAARPVNPLCGVHGPIPCEGARCICTAGVTASEDQTK